MIRKIFYTLWYFRNPPWDTNITPPELLDFIAQNKPGLALDLGCGTGTNVITLAQHGWQVTGIDFVAKAIRVARRKAKHAGVSAKFIVGDVLKLDFPKMHFDLILDIGCFHGLLGDQQIQYIENLGRYLKPGGTFLLYVFFKSDPTGSGPGVVEADLERIASQLNLVNRLDSTERGIRKAAWLTFRKDEG